MSAQKMGKRWALIVGTRPNLPATELIADWIWLVGEPTRRWQDPEGGINLIDGFMMDAAHTPLLGEGRLDPTATGYGNFAYLRIDLERGVVEAWADACESRNLYYAVVAGRLILSNDLPLLLETSGDRRVDDQSLFGYLKFGYLNVNHHTLFAGVLKLKACERLTASLTALHPKVGHYWKPALGGTRLTREEAIDAVEANLAGFFKGAMELMRRPLTTLTCGTDSNLFYYVLEKHVRRLRSLTHAFDHVDYDEFRLIEQARMVSPENMKIISYDDVLAYLSEAIGAIGLPINGLASMGEWKVYRQAHSLEADALITGVGDYIWVPVTQAKMDEIVASENLAYAGDGTLLAPTSYLSPDFHGEHAETAIPFYSLGLATDSKLKRHLLDQVFIKRTPHIASDHSALGNAFGLECLQPFVEKRTVEFCLGLDDDCLFFDDQPKSLLVTLLRRFHGARFPKGLKMNTPQRELIRTTYRPAIEQIIAESRLAQAGYIDKARLLTLFRDYLGQVDLGNSYFIWKFVVCEIWYRTMILEAPFDLYPDYACSPQITAKV